MRETKWPAKSKIITSWPFPESLLSPGLEHCGEGRCKKERAWAEQE